jgi:hypothetical protein
MPLRRIAAAAPVAGALAALANGLVYHLARERWQVSFELPINGPGTLAEPLSLVSVLVTSFLPALLAAGLFVLIGFFLPRPRTIFALCGALVAVFSLGVPLVLPEVDLRTRCGLVSLHLVAAAVIVSALLLASKQEPSR